MSGDEQTATGDRHESRFRAIFVGEPECVKLIGPDCRLIDMNPAGLRMIDAASVELVRGRNVLDLINPVHHQAYREAVDAAFRGESTQIQFEAIGFTGKRLWMDQSAAPLFDPDDPTRVVEMVAVTRDITAQRSAEAELLRAKVTEEIGRSKSEFLANISHELKTPLNHIIGYSELLQESARDEGRACDVTDHQRILDAAARLLSMINHMLSISLTDARRHKVCVDECDIGEVINDAVEALKQTIDANRNEITTELPNERGLWTCDSSKIDQCLRCLLSNAAKFTTDGVITVRVGHIMAEGRSCLQLEVIDTGEGIEHSRLATLFEPFADPETDRQTQEEIGLSLAVTRQLVRLMGGDLTVASTRGQGSHFKLRVPAEFHLDVFASRTRYRMGQSM